MRESSTSKSEPFANASATRGARESRRAEIAGVTVRYEGADGEAIRADALNISVDGIFVVATKPLAIGKRIAVDVHVAGEKKLVSAVGRIEWTREIAEGEARPAGMGLRFIDLDEEGVAMIRRLMAARPSTGDCAPTSAEAFPLPARQHLPTLHGVAPAPPMVPSRPSLRSGDTAEAVALLDRGWSQTAEAEASADAPVASPDVVAERVPTPGATPARVATPAPARAEPVAEVRAAEPMPSSRASIAAITVPPELAPPRRGRAIAIAVAALAIVGGIAAFLVTRGQDHAATNATTVATATTAPVTTSAPTSASATPAKPPAAKAAPAPSTKKPATAPAHKSPAKHPPAHSTKAHPKR